MKTTRTLFKTLDEVVFETRNKMYGAYTLRKNYGRRTLLSTAMGICLVMNMHPSKHVRHDHALSLNRALPFWLKARGGCTAS